MMIPEQPHFKKTYWIVLAIALVMGWGFHSGRVSWHGSPVTLAAYQMPAGGPTAEVHPEVLKLQGSFSRVAELVKPAVVSIMTTKIQQVPSGSPEFYFGDPFEEFFQQFFNGPGGGGPGGEAPMQPQPQPRSHRRPRPQEYKMEGVGSGVIIDPDGLVLTNDHVVRDADQIKVTVYEKDGDKKEYTGKVVGKDARTDIAVVRISVGHKLPYAALGDSDKVRVGDWAIAIGSPFNLAQTLTVGVISANHQTLPIEGREYRNLIQTDAAINRGNSGGPLLNIHGEVVGINTAIYAPTGVFAGIGFAVPINQAKAILEDLVKKGHVVRGWLGVELAREITPAMVKAFGLPDTKGALVNDVMKTSPAEKAGLKRGDVIRSFNGKAVESSDELQAQVSVTPPNKSVPVELIRNREKKSISLTLGERPESADTGESGQPESPNGSQKKEAKPAQREWLGAKVGVLTPEAADNYQQPRDAQGVVVMDIKPGSDADELGLVPGDVIRAVNQVPTPDLATFRKATDNVKISQGVVLDILRQGHPIYLSFTKQ
jgi:serine protease Do